MDKEDYDSRREVMNKAYAYIPEIFALTEVNNEHPPILKQLLKPKYLDCEYWLTLTIVEKQQSNFTPYRTGLLVLAALLQ